MLIRYGTFTVKNFNNMCIQMFSLNRHVEQFPWNAVFLLNRLL